MFKNFIKGIAIGSGAILPGISSGVLCVIFGIYDKLVQSVLGIFHDFKKNFLYLLPFAFGAFIGVLIFGNALSILLEKIPMPTKYAFIGLIIGSIPVLLKKINSEYSFKFQYLIFSIAAFAIGILMVILEKQINITNIANCSTSPLMLGLAGFCMSIGVVVPGVSSTIILMCFGMYDTYLQAISTMNLHILLPLGIGLIIGGFVFLKIIKYLLDYFYMPTFYSIIGFTLGSVLVLYMPISFDFIGLISIIVFVLCFYIAGLCEKAS